MERKWSHDLSNVLPQATASSSHDVLYHCSCFSYIRFLLGGRLNAGRSANDDKLGQKLLRVFRFVIPSILLAVFSVDLGDWIVNGEVALKLDQTRIISMLTYLDSQFGLWLGTATTFIFIFKCDQLLLSCESLGRSMRLLHMLPFPGTGPKRPTALKVAWAVIAILAGLSVFRGTYGVWEAANRDSFYKPRRYFVWRIPSGVISVVLKIFFLISELSTLPVHILFTYLCAKFSRCFAVLGDQIKELLSAMEKGQLVQEPFVEQLKNLSSKEVALGQAVVDFDDCFSVQVLFFVVNNSLGTFSKIAKCFVAAAFVSWMDYIKFAMKSSMYVSGLAIVILFPAMLHERVSTVFKWRHLFRYLFVCYPDGPASPQSGTVEVMLTNADLECRDYFWPWRARLAWFKRITKYRVIQINSRLCMCAVHETRYHLVQACAISRSFKNISDQLGLFIIFIPFLNEIWSKWSKVIFEHLRGTV